MIQELQTAHGRRISYEKIIGDSGINIIFLGGFKSDMGGSKAVYLHDFCQKHNHNFIRFDYSGHGVSSGKFVDGTIGQWLQDALEVLDNLSVGKQILVGSSMGGWIMLKLALLRPERIQSLVGIAAAPDFTQSLIWEQFSPQQKTEMEHKGVVYLPSCYDEAPYPITRALLEDGQKQCIINSKEILTINCPIRLLHGMADIDVPWQTALRIAEKVSSQDVQITFLKDGDHRLSEPEQLELLGNVISSQATRQYY